MNVNVLLVDECMLPTHAHAHAHAIFISTTTKPLPDSTYEGQLGKVPSRGGRKYGFLLQVQMRPPRLFFSKELLEQLARIPCVDALLVAGEKDPRNKKSKQVCQIQMRPLVFFFSKKL